MRDARRGHQSFSSPCHCSVLNWTSGLSERLRNFAIPAALVMAVVIPMQMAVVQASEMRPLRSAGLFPGMRLHAFRMVYGNATITRTTPIRYCYGQPIALKKVSRIDAIVPLGRTTINVGFERIGDDYQISTVKLQEEIYPRPGRILEPLIEQISKIRDELFKKFGPADRILRRRKMEPAGLIVGFQWNVPRVASLTAKIHRDHHRDPDRIYLTTHLTSSVRDPWRAQSARRGNRRTINAFHEWCRKRGRRPASNLENVPTVSQENGYDEAIHNHVDP